MEDWSNKKIGILGGGSWATALAKLLSQSQNELHWWMRNAEAVKHLQEFGHNPNYIQSIEFDKEKLRVTANMQDVVDACDVLVVAIPSAFVHTSFLEANVQRMEGKIIFTAIKGIVNEFDSTLIIKI